MWLCIVVILLELLRNIAAASTGPLRGCYGGAVEHHGPVRNRIDYVLKPPAKLYMAIRVLTLGLSGDNHDAVMEIHSGLSANAPVLATYVVPQDVVGLKETELTSRRGFFVRIHPSSSRNLHIKFTYTPFKLSPRLDTDCNFSMVERHGNADCDLDRQFSGALYRPGFVCNQSRPNGFKRAWCIPRHLMCDGFDHCVHEEDEAALMCQRNHLSASSQPVTRVCSPSAIQCPDGSCVREVAFCVTHPATSCLSPWVHPCKKGGRCFSNEEKCNGWQNCGDGSDEFDCNHNLLALGSFIGKTWFFLVPAVIMYLSLIIGCNWLLKKRKRQSDSASQFSRQETFQMTSVSGVDAPPSYEEYMLMQATPSSSAECPAGNQELPPSYEEVTLLVTSTSEPTLIIPPTTQQISVI